MYKEISTTSYLDIAKEYHVNSLLAKIVASFGYDEKDIFSFFHPIEDYVFGQTIFLPIKEVLDKIKQDNKKVFIFGDYDCDGICATTIAVKLLKKLNIECGYYIPDRIKEGYGLNLERLKQAKDKGYDVLLTVDNGVTKNEELSWAKENGMLTIVTDHHNYSSKVNCDYLLHPSLLEERYHYLSGAAVVYLLAKYLNLDDKKMTILAMLSIISDVMSLKGINISIVNEGLSYLTLDNYPNLLMLDKFDYPINETQISFKIVPKINSIGRLSDVANANKLVQFLLTDDLNEIRKYCADINKINSTRLSLTSSQYELVKQLVNEDDVFNFIYLEDLHEGLMGLIANKLMSSTSKTSFILTKSEDMVKCSARSEATNLMELLDGFKDNFTHFGGHDNACGFSMDIDKVDDLKQYLTNSGDKINEVGQIGYIDVSDEDLTYQNIKEVFSYRPFGQDRKIPLIHLKTNKIYSFQKLKTDNQLKWVLDNGLVLITFNNNKGYNYYCDKTEIEVIGSLNENVFNGRVTYQILINEIL